MSAPLSSSARVQDRIDRFVEDRLCPPLVARIPRRVTPNAITLATSALGWLLLGIAALVPRLPPVGRLLAMSAVAAGILACMIGDCLDGQHARRTGQATRFGEWLDHALDCMIVPLMAAIVVVALDVPRLPAVACVLCPVIGYNAQVILYRATGALPPLGTSGMVGQILAAGVCLLAGVALATLAPQATVLQGMRWAAGVIPLALFPGTLVPFYRRQDFAHAGHLAFLVPIAVGTGLFLAGAVGRWPWLLSITMLSLRLTGAWVTAAILRQPHHGFDAGAWTVALAALVAALAGAPPSVLGAALVAAHAVLALATVADGRRRLVGLAAA